MKKQKAMTVLIVIALLGTTEMSCVNHCVSRRGADRFHNVIVLKSLKVGVYSRRRRSLSPVGG